MKILYRISKDNHGELVAEAAKIVGIMFGIGATPFLQDRFDWFWAVGLAAGIVTIAAGIYYLSRVRHRERTASDEPLASFWERLARWGQRIWSALKSLVQFWRWRDRWQNRKQERSEREQRPLLLLPIFTISIGIFILIPSAAAFFLQRSSLHQNVGLIASYFNAPALLLWITGEGFYFYPHFLVRPKHWLQISGLLKSGLQAISALLLWVFLGVSISLENANWMLWVSLVTAVTGFIFGVIAIQSTKNKPVPAESGQTVPGTV